VTGSRQCFRSHPAMRIRLSDGRGGAAARAAVVDEALAGRYECATVVAARRIHIARPLTALPSLPARREQAAIRVLRMLPLASPERPLRLPRGARGVDSVFDLTLGDLTRHCRWPRGSLAAPPTEPETMSVGRSRIHPALGSPSGDSCRHSASSPSRLQLGKLVSLDRLLLPDEPQAASGDDEAPAPLPADVREFLACYTAVARAGWRLVGAPQLSRGRPTPSGSTIWLARAVRPARTGLPPRVRVRARERSSR
jgi:hypothetical protein